MASVSLNNITKKWGNIVGVDNQSIEINDKEFLVLLGPSGCGKTTTMRMIAGLEEPSAGEILIDGRVVNDDLPKDRDVAMVFQNYGLYPHMSIYDNIAYPLKVRGVDKADIRPRVETAAQQVELSEYLQRKPKALSGGQRQRVALARAIVRTPKVFLLDEPLSNLDAKLRVSMRAELKHLSRQLQVTTIYVTHDQIEAMTLADRVAVMNHGVIQQLGTPDQIYNDPHNLFVAGFIGSPAMNLIHGQIKNGWCLSDDGTPIAPCRSADRSRVVIGVRAEDITVNEPAGHQSQLSVYACENLGDSVLLTLQLGDQRVIARGDRHLRKEIDDTVSVTISEDHLYLFDPDTTHRIHKAE